MLSTMISAAMLKIIFTELVEPVEQVLKVLQSHSLPQKTQRAPVIS